MSVLSRHAVRVTGLQNGPPMMFAHGFGCDQTTWQRVAPAFDSRHRVILFDYIGAGSSDPAAYDPVRHGRLEGYADDVLDVLDALDPAPVVFVGHSVSAMIGALAAIRRPDRFAGLVMVGPSPCYIDRPGYTGGFTAADIDDLLADLDANYVGWSRQMAPVIMGNADRPALGQELADSFCRTEPRLARRFAEVTFRSDNRADLPRVPVPTLVLQCREDVIAPLTVGEHVRAAVPQADMIVLDATGHCPHLSAPDATIEAIRGFLGD